MHGTIMLLLYATPRELFHAMQFLRYKIGSDIIL